MPEYVAKAWYRDLAIWVSVLTIISGWLASPEVSGLIPQRVLSLIISGIGLVTLIVRTISTSRPVGLSDGSRSVQVRHIERGAKLPPPPKPPEWRRK